MVGVTGSIPVAPTIYSCCRCFAQRSWGRSGPRSSTSNTARRTAQIVQRRLPGPNVKHERRQHHGDTYADAGQDCGEAQPSRADAEIRGKFLAV